MEASGKRTLRMQQNFKKTFASSRHPSTNPSRWAILRRAGAIALILAIGFIGYRETASASHIIITFEEAIPVPGNVRTQYCSILATNRGVEFKFTSNVAEPSVATASPNHAMFNRLGGELSELGPMIISFTTAQTHVGVKVGLDRAYSFPVKAILRAYDDPDPSEGTKLTPTPDPSVELGNGPGAISMPLTFDAPEGEPTIRRVEIQFVGPTPGDEAIEVVDDLTFSQVGPPCITDAQSPSVRILEPGTDQTFNNPQMLLRFRVQDVGTGIASIRVSVLAFGGSELTSYYYCGGVDFPQTCPGFPTSLNVEAQYFTYLSAGASRIRVEARDFADNTGQAQVSFTMATPDATFNLWVLAMELTQGIRDSVPRSMESRGSLAPRAKVNPGPIPTIARKRTVVRVYPGLEATTVAVANARAALRCYVNLGATPGSGDRCDGPESIDPVNPEVTVDPGNNNDVTTLRLNPSLTWNFVLPTEWTQPGGQRWLLAHILAPSNLPECGSLASGCDDGANYFILETHFIETAPLLVQPRFACVRRSAGVPKENCDSVASTPSDAMDVMQWLLWARDWDGDGLLDPYLNVVLPVADGPTGIEILPPIMNDFVDGDLTTSDGIVSAERMEAYLNQVCDDFTFDWSDVFDWDEFGLAEGWPTNYRVLGILNSPPGSGGRGRNGHPCAVATINLTPIRVGDGTTNAENDFCSGCPNDSRFVLHWDEPLLAHELGHTFDIQHAGCSHDNDGNGVPDEQEAGGCDPAPSVFPCPHGGFCLSAAQQDEPFGFNTFNMAVLAPRNGGSHAHDIMALNYGAAPNWISPHTYGRLFDALRTSLTAASSARTSRVVPPARVLFVSGRVEPGKTPILSPAYQLRAKAIPKEGRGKFSFELQDGAGRVLVRRRFDPRPVAAEGGREATRMFHELMEFRPEAKRLVLKVEGRVVAIRNRSLNAPTVKILEPTPRVTWQKGRQTIRWEASDANQDALTYAIQYSKDAGRSWKTLLSNWSQPSLLVDATLLPGGKAGQARIRVIATDGFNSAMAVSGGFTIADKPPHVSILIPRNHATIPAGQSVDLIGGAIDPDDGTLKSSAYAWKSDRDGVLGIGHDIQFTPSSGDHTVTLFARDGGGNVSSASITIRVLGTPNTQPIANAGRDQSVRVALIALDGRASSDTDGDALSFSWRLVSAPHGSGTLLNSRSATPRLVARIPGKYVLQLIVRDGEVNSPPDYVEIHVTG